MKKLGLKEQIFIAVVVAVLMIIVCAVFIWKPQYDRVASAQQQQKEEESNLQSKIAELEGLKQAKKDAPQIESESLKLNKQMPEDQDIATLVVELEQAAKDSGVKILDLDFTNPAVIKNYSTISFSGGVQGTYFNIADYIYQITAMPRQIKISKIDLEYSDEGYPLLSASIDYTTYVYSTDVEEGEGTTGGTSSGSSASEQKVNKAKDATDSGGSKL